MVYLVILVTIQRQFINVRYRDVSKVVNMVRIGPPIYIQPKQVLHPYIFNATTPFHIQDIRGAQKNIGFVNMCGLVHVGHVYFVLSRLFTQQLLQSHMFAPHKRLVRNSMPCQLKTLLHQYWSQMKAVVQLFKGK